MYSDLNFSAISVFIAGVIKVGERVWVFWSASSQQFMVGDHTYITAGDSLPPEAENEETYRLKTAKYFFKTFKLLFADLILNFRDVWIQVRHVLYEGGCAL